MINNNSDHLNNFSEYIGQQNTIENLMIFIASAIRQEISLDHIIIHGPSGYGKTTLANLIAKQMNKKIVVLNGPSLQKPSDIISPLTTLKNFEFIFIDEVHAVSKDVLEIIYPVLENNELSVIIGKDYNSKVINIKLKPFTMICATTEINKLPTPFVNRFSINFQLQSYNVLELTKIIFNYANKNKLPLSWEAASHLAQFTKCNPRNAINILKRLNDYYIIESPIKLDINFINQILLKLQIFKFGLSIIDIKYLRVLESYDIVGIDSMAQILNLSQNIIQTNIEPILIKEMLISKTSRGRKLTDNGLRLLNEIRK